MADVHEMLAPLETPRTRGLFVTGTDTEVGKTVVSCLIADQLVRRLSQEHPAPRVGVMKPIASGCRREREGLVSDDAEELAFAAQFDPEIGGLEVVNPVRLKAPLAPAVALAERGEELDVESIRRSLHRIDESCDALIVEGVGGVMVPLARDPAGSRRRPRFVTVLDLMEAIGYPVVVVCRADLGTLNHTALTCAAIRSRGLALAGLVVNGHDPDSEDESTRTNREWLIAQNHAPVLATLPAWTRSDGSPRTNRAWDVRAVDPGLREALDVTDFGSLCRPGRRV